MPERAVSAMLVVASGMALVAIAPAHGGQSCESPFVAAWALPAGEQPTSVVVGDLDGDGDADVVVANETSHSLTISSNIGGGWFETSTIGFPFGTAPRSLVAADLDRDGDLDLAFLQQFENEVWVLLNNGSGSFAAPRVFPTFGSAPSHLSTGDMDGDGDLDLAVSNGFSNSLTLLRNTGGGLGFQLAQTLPAGVLPRRTAWSDVDGDGDLDLAAASFDFLNPIVRVFRNDGVGRFGDPDEYPLDSITRDVAFADMDGDGDEDLLWSKGVGQVCVSRNEGGVFVDERCFTAGQQPEMLAIADLDGDGDQDVAVPDFANFEVYPLMNAGDGTLTVATSVFTGEEPRQVVAADIDGDGAPDLAVPNARANDAAILINDGTGSFGGAGRIDAGEIVRGVVAADIDGDGDDDLLVASARSATVRVLLQDAGGFSIDQTIGLGGEPARLAVGDLDMDGDSDALVLTDRGGFVESLINDGHGAWRSAGRSEVNADESGLELIDADGDGDLDAIMLGESRGVRVAFNNGRGVFGGDLLIDIGENPTSLAAGLLEANGRAAIAVGSRDDGLAVVYELGEGQLIPQGRFPIGRDGRVLALADVNADGYADLVANDGDELGIAVWPGDGRGGLGQRVFSGTGQFIGMAALRDVNGDGTLDLAALTTRGGVQSLLGDGAGGFAFAPALTIAEVAQGLVAADLDGDGRVDIGVGDFRQPVVHLLRNRCQSRCRADLDQDGELTIFDFLEYQNLFDAGDPSADFDGDGELTIFDFLAFQNEFDAGCD
ncbi:MAG: FG-GAP-like repeat-containing protein [Phycisphaerales bacterium JB064]